MVQLGMANSRMKDFYDLAVLARDFDFSVKEGYPYARDKAPWPKDDAEVRDLWRKRVKNDWLRLKLAGKDDKAIRETLGKRYDNYLARATRNKSEDVFQVFMNAYAMSIEPHTNYLGRSASDDFDISMRLSLVGIGAAVYSSVRGGISADGSDDSMVMTMRAVHVAVRDFLGGGGAHRLDGGGKADVLAGQRVVGVQQHLGALDLDHAVDHRPVRPGALQLAAHLDAGRKLAFGDAARQGLVARAEGVGRAQRQRHLVAHGLALQRRFGLGKQVVVAAVQVGGGAGIQRLALEVGDAVVERDGGVLGDVHGRWYPG